VHGSGRRSLEVRAGSHFAGRSIWSTIGRDWAPPSEGADSRHRRLLMDGHSQAISIQDKENSGDLQQEASPLFFMNGEGNGKEGTGNHSAGRG
jgi:hypothetical protein